MPAPRTYTDGQVPTAAQLNETTAAGASVYATEADRDADTIPAAVHIIVVVEDGPRLQYRTATGWADLFDLAAHPPRSTATPHYIPRRVPTTSDPAGVWTLADWPA